MREKEESRRNLRFLNLGDWMVMPFAGRGNGEKKKKPTGEQVKHGVQD